jgi:signal transduction histidine kinase
LIDSCGNIVAVNSAWSQLAKQTHTTNQTGLGINYLDVCRRSRATCPEAREALMGIQAVIKKRISSFAMDYAASIGATQPHYFRMSVTPFCFGDAEFAIAHVDITDMYSAAKQHMQPTRELGQRIIAIQERERERIACELHDDLGNRIALLSFAIDALIEDLRLKKLRVQQLMDLQSKCKELSEALRYVSHSLHPHLLRRFGLHTGLKVLCEDFKRTSGIQIDTTISTVQSDLSKDAELCILRVVQESLHNISKHSSAATASVLLERGGNYVKLVVADTGCGFVESEALQKGGIGLVSMKERVHCIGGYLEVKSRPGTGTEIRVSIPAD